jgi:hypothetical protein
MTLQGWRITTLVTCLIVVGLLFNFGLAGWNAPAITHAIDATGRSSLILFAIAFTASSVESLGRLLSLVGRCGIGVGSVSVSLHPISSISV